MNVATRANSSSPQNGNRKPLPGSRLDFFDARAAVDAITPGAYATLPYTVRAAKNLGFRCTLVEDACATRDLPYKGGILSADHVQQTEMAIMADNFATLALTKDLI